MNRGWCDLYSQHLRGKKYYQAGYHPHLPALPACLHCSHRSSRVNTRDNIVHTKHWLGYQWHVFTAALQLEGRSLVPSTSTSGPRYRPQIFEDKHLSWC